GQLILVADPPNHQAILWRGDRPGEPRLLRHRGAHYVALSPDGCWAATGTWWGDGTVKVWDTATGRQVQELPTGGNDQVAFSPDGKWLVTGGPSKYRFWHVPSWHEEAGLAVDRVPPFILPGPLAFAPDPDGRLLALARSTTEVQLYELTSDGRI